MFGKPGKLRPLDAALFDAIERHDGDAALGLIARGADVNALDRFEVPVDRERVPARRTPLMAAIEVKDVLLALELMSVPGIDFEIDDGLEGRTALIEAVRFGDRTLVEALLAAGASPLARTRDGRIALDYAIEAGHGELADRLLGSGRPPDLVGPLTEAAFRGQRDLVFRLLGEGADINGANSVGDTPLIAAAWGGREALLLELLQRGAAVERSGGEALARAASSGHAGIVRRLVAHGVPVDVRGTAGWTPLMSAAWQNQAAAVRCLLELGADRGIKDDAGKTALDWARQGGHREIVALLT